MARTTVIQVITHLPPGGAQRVALTLAGGLDRESFDLHLVAGDRGAWVERARKLEGCTFHPAGHLVREISPVHDLSVVPQLVGIFRQIRKQNPQHSTIVHTHAPKAGVAGRWAARLCGCRVVHTLHGLPFDTSQGKLKRGAYRLFESMGYRAGGELVSVTQTNLDLLRAQGMLKEGRGRVIRPSVDMEKLKPRTAARKILPQFGIGERQRVAGMVASLKPPKDPLTFIRAASLLVDDFPDLHFVLAGDGDLRPAVEAEINRFDLTDRVTLLGWFDPIEELYPELDLLALPTFNEGLPLVLVEARACGVPVIASRVGGIHELIGNDKNGLLVMPGDPKRLAYGISRLLEEEELRRLVIDAGLQELDEYREESMIRAHEHLYREILGS